MPINRTASPRWMAGAALLAAATAVFVPVLSATAQASGRHAAPVVNPYSPAYHHPYRHGVVPTIQGNAQMRHWARTHLQAPAAHDLNYGGGIGVTAGHEKVYLVFYGSQWGTQGTDATGAVEDQVDLL